MPAVTLTQVVWHWAIRAPSLVAPSRPASRAVPRTLYPPVPAPQANLLALQRTCAALKQNVDRITGVGIKSHSDQAASITFLQDALSDVQARLLALERSRGA